MKYRTFISRRSLDHNYVTMRVYNKRGQLVVDTPLDPRKYTRFIQELVSVLTPKETLDGSARDSSHDTL